MILTIATLIIIFFTAVTKQFHAPGLLVGAQPRLKDCMSQVLIISYSGWCLYYMELRQHSFRTASPYWVSSMSILKRLISDNTRYSVTSPLAGFAIIVGYNGLFYIVSRS